MAPNRALLAIFLLKAFSRISIFAVSWWLVLMGIGQGEESSRGLSFTVKPGEGTIYTISLTVPKTGSGACKIISVVPTMVSGPAPIRPAYVYTTQSYTTNFTGVLPAAGAVLPSPDFVRLAGFARKELGTLILAQGTTYPDCRLLTFQKDGVIVLWSGGATKILFSDLTPASREQVEIELK